jgi:hypothetical protein
MLHLIQEIALFDQVATEEHSISVNYSGGL